MIMETILNKPTLTLANGAIFGTINGTINGTEKQVFDTIYLNHGITGPKLSEITGIPLRTLKRIIPSLQEKDVFIRKGSKKTSGYNLL